MVEIANPAIEKLLAARRVYQLIKDRHAEGIRESDELDRLKEKLEESEREIGLDIIGPRKEPPKPIDEDIGSIPAVVLNYCFRSPNIYGSGFDNVDKVQSFMSRIDSIKGQRILTITCGDCLVGKISGPSRIDVNNTFYNMVVPVERESFFRLKPDRIRPGIVGKWVKPYELDEEGTKPEIYVANELLFAGEGSITEGHLHYNHGGSSSQRRRDSDSHQLYFGDDVVQDRLQREIVIPRTEVRVQLPD